MCLYYKYHQLTIEGTITLGFIGLDFHRQKIFQYLLEGSKIPGLDSGRLKKNQQNTRKLSLCWK